MSRQDALGARRPSRHDDLSRAGLATFVHGAVPMRCIAILIWLAAATSIVHAGPNVNGASEAEAPWAALAVNMPLLWKHSVGVSGWIQATGHQAIRINVARYRAIAVPILASIIADGGAPDSGQFTDLGAGWVYFPAGIRNGFIEADGVYRLRERSSSDHGVTLFERHTTTYAARALAGVALRSDWMFMALAAGMSVGYERGQERAPSDLGTMTTRVSRADVGLEGYLRFGVAFGL